MFFLFDLTYKAFLYAFFDANFIFSSQWTKKNKLCFAHCKKFGS